MKPSARTIVSILPAVVSALIALSAASTHAAPLTPELRCEIGKLKAVATYSSCRLKADITGLTKNLSPDFSRCESKFTLKFPRLEEQADPAMCPSSNDVVDLKDRTDDFEAAVSILLGGGTLPIAACGDGTLDLGEDCEVGDLDGETCATQGFFNGALACGPGCSFDTSGCHLTRFEDNGPTVLDHQTKLEWEKKGASNGVANLADPHDSDNTYTWAAAASNTTQSGTAFSDFLFKLNGVVDHPSTTTLNCYAGHCDWRLPTIDEWKAVAVAACAVPPCVQDAMLLPMQSGFYWSNSTRAAAPAGAYNLDFNGGAPVGDFKTSSRFARAVRSTN